MHNFEYMKYYEGQIYLMLSKVYLWINFSSHNYNIILIFSRNWKYKVSDLCNEINKVLYKYRIISWTISDCCDKKCFFLIV